jgi:beta-phosphoglucomutase
VTLRGVIFDLDGVITDTAEYHYLSWKRLADEQGLPFSRADNEQLRGVSRLQSLLLILGDRQLPEERLNELMSIKNAYYQEMLVQVSPADLLPGVAELLDELDGAAIPYAIASASRNARDVVQRLGLAGRLAAIADGNSVARTKPAPDLFRFAAAQLGLMPHEALVVEDAAAGIAAALAAGMPALALGPEERFAELGAARCQFARRDSLDGATLADLRAATNVAATWHVVENHFAAHQQHHMETVFTTGNGYFASRGSLEEGYPEDHALTLAHGLFDDMPIVFTELVNLPNWLDLQIRIDGQLFRLDRGEVTGYWRSLDLHNGLLQRHVQWRAPGGALVNLTFERFISYTHVHLGALRLLITPVDRQCAVAVSAGVDGHVANDNLLHWRHLEEGYADDVVWLHSQTRATRLELAAAARLQTPDSLALDAQQCPAHPALAVHKRLEAGQTLQIDKLVAYASSRDEAPGETAQGVLPRALLYLQGQDYDRLKAAHMAGWQDAWQEIDVTIDGDDEAQLAIRFNLFQLQVAAPRHDDRVSIGAKTLSGLGYRGHVFWDTEIFILPFFTYTQPAIARNLLLYRYHTLPGARRKAAANGYRGAQYAWESAATGDEVTPSYVPTFDGKGLVRIWTGDIEIHISADVAYAIMQYWRVTGDDAFMRDYGAEMILETARFWADRAEPEEGDGELRYAYRDVIGPDEYHDHVDNNAYTNRLAQWHLETALELAGWLRDNYPEKATALLAELHLDEEELAQWREVARRITILYDEESGLFTQFEGFFDLEPVDWPVFADRTQSLQVLLGIEGANESQVIKQPDVLMMLLLLRDHYTDPGVWQDNWETYEPISDHEYGSSLGPSFHAWAACHMGEAERAYNFFMLAARADLQNVRGNAGDGIHAASAGGLWQAIAFGFAGLRLTGDGYEINPCLPPHWERLAFSFYLRGQRQQIDIRQERG